MSERIPALDGIRGIAILSVLIDHVTLRFPAPTARPAIWIHGALYMNWPGVDSFFVLSGFLITGILLDARGEGERPPSRYFSSFYARRVLRILPVYYLYLFWLLVLQRTPIPEGTGVYFWTYTQNVMLARGQHEITEMTALWSLAIEEQFYILWPALVALVPRRYFQSLCWAIIGINIALAVAFLLRGNVVVPHMFLYADELAAGALVAAMVRDPRGFSRWADRLSVAAAVCFAIVWVISHKYFGDQRWVFVQSRAAALVTALSIYLVARRSCGPLSAILRWGPLRSWGKYSYAIYVVHMSIVIPACVWLIAHWPRAFPQGLVIIFAGIAVSLILCWVAGWISYRVVEGPILSLKRFVPMPTVR